MGLVLTTSLPGNFSFARGAQPSQISIQSFPFYRFIQRGNESLLIQSSGKGQPLRMAYSKGRKTLNWQLSQKQTIYHLQSWDRNRTFHVYLKSQGKDSFKVGFLSEIHRKEYSSKSPLCPEDRTIEGLLAGISMEDLTTKLENLTSSQILDEKSCPLPPRQLKMYSRMILDELNPQNSFLMKCLTSKEAQSEFAKDEKLQGFAFQTLSSYLNDVNFKVEGPGQLKFGCFDSQKEGKDKNSLYDPSAPAIRFPVANGELAVPECQTPGQLITHEYGHRGGIRDPLNHRFDLICAKALKVPQLDQEQCQSYYKIKEGACEDAGCQMTQTVATIQNAAERLDEEQHSQIAPVLQETIQASEIKPLASEDVDAVMASQSPKEVTASADRLMNTFSGNMEGMLKPLNAAVAVAIPSSYAAASSNPQSSKKTSKRLPAHASLGSGSTRNEEYIKEEILADQYKVPISVVDSALKQKKLKEQQDAEPESKILTQSTAPQNSVETAVAPTGRLEKPGSASSAANLSLPGRRTPAALPASAGSKPDLPLPQVLQSLNQYSEVRGSLYSQVRDLYQDPQFVDQLKRRSISIELQNGSQKKVIGVPTQNSKLQFIDNGQSLKRITRKKP